MDYTALATEINSGPLAGTLAPLVAAGNDAAIAALLNADGAGLVPRGVEKASVVLAQIDPGEFSTLQAADLTRLQILLQNEVDLSDPNIQADLDSVFSAKPLSKARMVALRMLSGSRAEMLFGRRVTVTAADVAHALRG